ncbi:MAG: hypothetical protein HY744_23705 [Deltaproteobacteria bacterium]|nr:hypothetical protein [Deltaproteobacteria bacterium]
MSARPGVLLLALGAAFLCGCAGHEARVKAALDALDRGAPAEAVGALNEELAVTRAEDLPPQLGGDEALLVLDRAAVLQSMDRYELSARDFGAADKAIDLLDLSRSAAHDVGRYLFSDDVGPYRAPGYEKLLINTFNMMNYLALRDLSGTRVEARRLAVVQRYLKDRGEHGTLLGLGSYLAGFAFEKSAQRDEALRHYDEALGYASYGSLAPALRALTGGQPYSPAVDRLVGASGDAAPAPPGDEAEILVVVGYGRVPQKIPVRIPIGLALTLVASDISPRDHALATSLAAKGLVTWVNFPRLGPSRGRYDEPTLALDGSAQPLEPALDVEAEVRRIWQENEGTLVLAAITRMLARAVAGEAAGAATSALADDDSGALGLLAGLFTTAALSAADTPDTRGWSTLPARLAVARLRVRPGKHRLAVSARGETKRYAVTVGARDWVFVGMQALR